MTRHKRATLPARNLRLAEQIQKDLAALIQREIDVARAGLITLSRVELSVNYAHARVYFTVLGAEPEVAASALNDKAGWLHSQLYRMLHIHTVPTLRFFHDPQLERAIEMSRLIDEVKRSDAARLDSVAPAATDPAQTQAAEAEPAEPAAPDDPRAPL